MLRARVRWSPRRRLGGLVLAVVAATLTVPVLTAAPASADPCGPGGSVIACENSKPGADWSEWEVDGAGDASIQGFATDISTDVGQRVDFKIDTDASAYTITIYRIGYYGGDGAREIARVTPSASLPQDQPPCLNDVSTGLVDCGNWAVSASWDVPATAVSGVYVAKLHRADLDHASHITFVVRDDSSHSDVVFQTSDTTWQAYNRYGGSSFYVGSPAGRAYKLSYNRPVTTRDDVPYGRDFFFANEYPLVRFLEKNGYDVSYIAGVDTDRHGSLLTNHETFLSVGHDEYWSGAQRANVEAARDAGVNLMFLSGNEVYWRTRYEPSIDPSQTSYRTLVSYKETWSNAKVDPSPEWTGTWRDPRFAPRSQGAGRTENGLTGTAYVSNFSDLPLTVRREEGRLRLWRHTDLATTTATQTELTPGTVGYESNEDLDNGERPPGLIRLSTTTGAVPQYLTDFGNTVVPGETTHHTTMYRAASGALVFSAGTIQWTWGLDDEHDGWVPKPPPDPRMQQAQVNLLADMGAQPTTLAGNLVAATASTDTTPPTVTIASPDAGADQQNGTRVTVTGTASDVGGRVAGVEVSTDGGETWHAATGRSDWSYTFVQHGRGSTPVQVRAMDDSANIGAPVTRSFDVSCLCSIFGDTDPENPATADNGSLELGLRFTPTSDGFITGVRFHKSSGNTGTHVGSLWTSGAEKLASVTFTNETATGWQTASFSSPVAVAAGQTYVVSYTAPNGRYAADPWAFSARPHDADALLVDGGFGAAPAGVYANAGAFPTQSYRNTNYYVDVLFSTTDDSPLIATNHWPLPDSSSVPLDTTVSARFNKPLAAGSASVTLRDSLGDPVPGTSSYDSGTRTVTFTPSVPLAGFVRHTATLTGTDTQGQELTTGRTWSFTTVKPPGEPGVCPCTLFDETLQPTVLNATDGNPLSLGVRFASSQDGQITGLKFYKSPNNTGVHTGTLWSAAGTALATGTFTAESSSGWQTLLFDTPVDITRDTEYVVSYRSPTGWFSMTPNAFSSADLSRAPLRVNSRSGSFTYGTGFPSSSSASNYLVDPIFEPPRPSITVTSQEPAPGAVDADRGAPVVVRFSAPLAPGHSLTLAQGDTALPGSLAINDAGTKLTLTPAQPFAKDVDITVTLSDVTSTNGASMPGRSWTFHTSGDDDVTAPQSLFGDETPSVLSATTDTSPVEVGTAFTPTTDGRITRIRFFKGPGNGGTHTGSLWSSTGTRLATVTFTDETVNGWQTATLPTPVPVTEGTTYVVSYLAPQGRYSYTPGFFSTPWTSGDLTAPTTNNGRYLYGAAGGFPTFSWNATNYFVDVVFKANPPTIAITDRTPAPGATDVLVGTTPSIGFSAPLAPGHAMTVTQGDTAIPGTVALSGNGKKLTFTPSSPLPVDSEVTVAVTDVVSTRGAVLPDTTWTFRTEPAPTAFASLMDGLVPATAAVSDNQPIELGTAFTPSRAGVVTAVKFYKGTGNTGTHTGSIWSSTGTRLATTTFTNETASGWQTANLSTPLPLTAGQTYVVSYYAPNGRYAATGGYFSTPRSSGPLSAPTTNNGRYRYGTGGGFPTSSWNATNYFVDVVYRYYQ